MRHGLATAAVFVLSLWFTDTAVAADDWARVEGRIVTQDGAGVGGVTVTLAGVAGSELSDADGHFRFERVPPGALDLSFTLGDRVVRDTSHHTEAGAVTTTRTVVDWTPNFAETITVQAASRHTERIVEAPAAVTVVDPRDFDRATPQGQLPRLFAYTPGAEPTQMGLYDYNFNTRGFNNFVTRRMLVLIDGRDPSMPLQLGGQEWGGISFALDELESAEILRGPTAALYGAGAFNGVLNMTTKAPLAQLGGTLRLTGGELDSRRADLRHAADLGSGWSMKLVAGFLESEHFTVSRVETPEYAPGLIPTEAVAPPLDQIQSTFGSLRFDKDFDHRHSLTLEGGTAAFEGTAFVTGLGRFQQSDVTRPWLRVNWNAPHWNFLGYYTGRDSNDQLSLASGGKLFLDTSNAALEWQIHDDFAGGRGRVVGGAFYAEQSADSAAPDGTQTVTGIPRDLERTALFGQVDYELGSRLDATLSLRWDDSDQDESRISPRAGLVFAVSPFQTIRLSFGDGFLRPTLGQRFLQVPVGPPVDLSGLEAALEPVTGGVALGFEAIPFLAVGNNNLEPEEITTFELGYSAVVARRAFFTATYYRSELTNFTTPLLSNVGTSLGRLNPDFGPYQPPSELSPAAADIVLATLEAALPASLFAFMSNFEDGSPTFAVLSFANAGRADTEGLELGLTTTLADGWSLDASYSLFEFEIRDEAPEDPLQANAPQHQFSLGLSFVGDRIDGSLKARWVDSFLWQGGLFTGPVPSYTVVDLSGSYSISERWRVGLDVANLLDDVHYEAFGADLLRRRALATVSYTW